MNELRRMCPMRIGPSQPRGDERGPEPLQLAVDPMRTWVNDGKGGRMRPGMCVVVGGHTGLCLGMEIGQSEQAGFELAGRLLAKPLHPPRPAGAAVRVQVRDPEL